MAAGTGELNRRGGRGGQLLVNAGASPLGGFSKVGRGVELRSGVPALLAVLYGTVGTRTGMGYWAEGIFSTAPQTNRTLSRTILPWENRR